MEKNDKLKLFISYSHHDESFISDFIKHITPLKDNGLIDDWYDRKIVAGKDFQERIDNNLKDADIVCLFISADFLSSNSCKEEKKNVLELRRKKGIAVIPIILSPCGWLDYEELARLLALPEDGKSVSEYPDSSSAWKSIYDGLKVVIEEEITVKQLMITDQFEQILQSTELLSKAHSQKDKVLLDDVFVYPELIKYDELREYERKETSEKLIEDFCDYPKILIAGENQSGKTSLCKKIFKKLRQVNFVPIYVSDKENTYKGKIENIISKAFKEEYEAVPMDKIDRRRIVPILDDFHLAKNKEKHIKELESYGHQIVIVDDIFSLNVKDEDIIRSFAHFKIVEFIPSLRDQLIRKWTNLTDDHSDVAPNEFYRSIDSKTELVNTTLGKIIGTGIMPSYPFFIMSIISAHETFAKPLDREITSQGYCYQALIYLYLRKQGVMNDEVDTYINFLTEFAFKFYSMKRTELSEDEFNSFMQTYLEEYNLPVQEETLLSRLRKTHIIAMDDCHNYSFCYTYLYYFFVGKYLSENIDDNKETIDSILANLHKDENAYIAVFISHHAKSDYVLDEISLNAGCLFEGYTPATLSKDELKFFDDQVNTIVEAVLPSANKTPEEARSDRLKAQDAEEQSRNQQDEDISDDNNELALELRRSIKTVEVMGGIIKNRAGSLEKTKLESIFEEAMNVHLRILMSFFELIKREEEQEKIVSFIKDRLNKFIEKTAEERRKEGKKDKIPSEDELEKISKRIFWNINFFTVYGFIDKIVHSLGSRNLTAVIEKVCDSENTSASFLVKHGILMWYNKNLQVENIAERIDNDDFAEIAKKVIRFMIVNHSSMHVLSYKQKQKIEQKIGVSSQRLLLQQAKADRNKKQP